MAEGNADMEQLVFSDDAIHAKEVKNNTLKLLNLGIDVYYFTYSACFNDVENFWALVQCDKLAQPLTAEVLGF